MSTSPNPTRRRKIIFPPALALFFAILAVSTASLLIRFAQSEVPSLVIAAYRLTLASVITAVFTFPKYLSEIISLKKGQWLLVILSGIFLAFHFASWITSLELTSVTSSVVLVTTTPIWVALLSPLVLKERNSWQVGICLIIALLGSLVVTFSKSCLIFDEKIACSLINHSAGSSNLWGNILALMGAFMAAGYVMAGRNLRATINLLPYTLLVYSAASVVLILLCIFSGYSLIGFSSQSYLWLILLALVPQIFGHTTLNWALRFVPAAFVSITLLGEPVGSSILAWIFLRESPTFFELIGAALILFGIIFLARSLNHSAKGELKTKQL